MESCLPYYGICGNAYWQWFSDSGCISKPTESMDNESFRHQPGDCKSRRTITVLFSQPTFYYSSPMAVWKHRLQDERVSGAFQCFRIRRNPLLHFI